MARHQETNEERWAREKAERQARIDAYPVKATDLSAVSRHSDRCLTTVTLEADWDLKIPWLRLGQAQLRRQRESEFDGTYRLEAYLPEGVTDFEHDSAYVLRLPLIGVTFRGIEYHSTRLTAWVDPNCADRDFHVPGPGYNPTKHPKAVTCQGIYDEKKKLYCKYNEGKPHVIVPEGHYVPPFDPNLYKHVRGKKVEIEIGVAYPKGE